VLVNPKKERERSDGTVEKTAEEGKELKHRRVLKHNIRKSDLQSFFEETISLKRKNSVFQVLFPKGSHKKAWTQGHGGSFQKSPPFPGFHHRFFQEKTFLVKRPSASFKKVSWGKTVDQSGPMSPRRSHRERVKLTN